MPYFDIYSVQLIMIVTAIQYYFYGNSIIRLPCLSMWLTTVGRQRS